MGTSLEGAGVSEIKNAPSTSVNRLSLTLFSLDAQILYLSNVFFAIYTYIYLKKFSFYQYRVNAASMIRATPFVHLFIASPRMCSVCS